MTRPRPRLLMLIMVTVVFRGGAGRAQVAPMVCFAADPAVAGFAAGNGSGAMEPAPLVSAAGFRFGLGGEARWLEKPLPEHGTAVLDARRTPPEDDGLRIATTLAAGPTVRAIRQCPLDRRQRLAADLAGRIALAAEALARLQRETRSAEMPAAPQAALRLVAWREDQLRKSLDAARAASLETWPDARAAVAADYAAYADAVARAEASLRDLRMAPPEPSSPGDDAPPVIEARPAGR